MSITRLSCVYVYFFEFAALEFPKWNSHSLKELIQISGDTAERRGLLGGRYKKKWTITGDPADLSRAITECENGMRLDLNDYYPSSNLARLYRTRNRKGDDGKARISASITLVACERARARSTDDEWLNSTLLGAAFDAGDVQKLNWRRSRQQSRAEHSRLVLRPTS
jgi:hypothetical protein